MNDGSVDGLLKGPRLVGYLHYALRPKDMSGIQRFLPFEKIDRSNTKSSVRNMRKNGPYPGTSSQLEFWPRAPHSLCDSTKFLRFLGGHHLQP